MTYLFGNCGDAFSEQGPVSNRWEGLLLLRIPHPNSNQDGAQKVKSLVEGPEDRAHHHRYQSIEN